MPSSHEIAPARDPGIAAKVAFLSDPRNYPEGSAGVQAVETHLSWVFLTERHAWKLKKPVLLDHRDLSGVTERRDHCRMEMALNRRLSDDVYLDVVPLAVDPLGRLGFDARGAVVEWLIRMRRLPDARMLDRLVRERRLRPGELQPAVERLARFYTDSPPPGLAPGEFRERFERGIADNATALRHPEAKIAPERVARLCAAQLAFLEREAPAFDRRVAAGRVVEGHGDLRPEHVCLEPRPQFIDCLEFSRELRIVDGAEEIAFLGLECERLGSPWVKRELFAALDAITGDGAPVGLVDFYQSYLASIRAKIAIWHLEEPERRDRERWCAQARDYFELSEAHLPR